jgi:hypothetical protein
MTRPSPSRQALALAVLPAILCLAAAPAAKAPAKPPPAKPAAAAPAAAFESTNPQSLMTLLGDAGAKVQTNRRDEDSVFVAVTSTAANFSLQFAGCNPQGRACKAVLFDTLVEGGAPTLQQINGFNQTSVFCRLYQDKQGKPHATYAALLVKSDTRDSAVNHLAAWQGCIAESRDFVRDPVSYLSNAA